jgi:STE24 endopeptidase
MLYRIAIILAIAVAWPLLAAIASAAEFNADAATEAYLATVGGAARAKSDAYFEGGYWLILWDGLYSIAVALILLFTRASAGMRDLAESLTSWRWLQTFIYAALFIVVAAIMTFPLTLHEGFYREHAFGLSNLSMNDWLQEYAIGLAVNVLMSGIFLVGLYAVIRRTGEAWWLWGAGVTILFVMFGALVAPVFIAPLFNDYKPMREGELKQQILSIARANGVPANDVFEFDASKQHKRISANVSGFLGTTRISLNDNLLNRSTPAEVKAVMAHEIGHYALGHINEMIISLSLMAAIAFIFTDIGFYKLHGVFGAWWGVRDIADPAGLPVIVMILSLLGMLATPLSNSIVRTNEAEADIFGLNAAREPDGFATTALKLSEYRKLDPTPWEEFIFYDHPSGRSRISMAMRWKAEHLAELPFPEDSDPLVAEPPPTPASWDSPGQ